MARYSAGHKEKTRDLVIDLAASCIRRDGLEGLGVAKIMAEAGLTHGGFYAHFSSRDQLLAAAVARLFDHGVETIAHFKSKHGEAALERYVDFYLSPRHRDDLTGGCPIPALSSEVRHAASEVRAAFEEGLDRLSEALGAITPGGRKAALSLLGEMAGVLALSRTLSDAKRSSEMLASARRSALLG